MRFLEETINSSERPEAPPVPDYLRRHYWWAYLYPWAVKFWDHLWMVNLILLGNFSRLRSATLTDFKGKSSGNALEIACVYGDLVPKLAEETARCGGRFDVIDVLPIQLENARRKIKDAGHVRFFNMDAARLELPQGHYDRVLIYFLLHELPDAVRRQALREALRVVKPGGELVIVDFAKPYWWNPFRYLWCVFLAIFEPFALGMWWNHVREMMPERCRNFPCVQSRYFGGLFQKTVFTCR